jgi:hypothetical protein
VTDVLTLSIDLQDGKYASQNSIGKDGFRGGRKSDVYKQVFSAVKRAAEDEIKLTGWTKAECECAVLLIRYIPIRWRVDAINAGTAEFNALTAAGVWADDRLGNPPTLWIRHDPVGLHRISIVVVKLYEPANASSPSNGGNGVRGAGKPRRARTQSSKESPAVRHLKERAWRPGDPIPVGYAQLGNELITDTRARELIGGGK